MIDAKNNECRYVTTPDGRAWMWGGNGNERTVHFSSGDKGPGKNVTYSVEELEEIENERE